MSEPRHILIVEDCVTDFKLIEHHLKTHGLAASCHQVASLAELNAALDTGSWDVVLSDYRVPQLDFEDCLHVLQARLPEAPVILVSGTMGEERAVELLKSGVWGFVLKDNLTRLASQIERSLQEAAEIRERKRAEEALCKSEKKFRCIVETANEGIWMLGTDLLTTFVNARMAGMTGYSVEELIGRPFTDVMFPEDVPDHHKRLEARKQAMSENYERRIRRKDGQTVWVLISASPILDDEHRFQGTLAMFTDITERKQAEGAMIASEVRYRRLFEAAKDGILILNAATGSIVDVNPFLIELLGYSRASFIGKHLWDMGFFKDIAANEANFKELQAKDYICYDDLPLETSDGRRIKVEFVSNAYIVDGHRVMQCNIRDITERKRAEESHARLAMAVEQAAETIVITDPQGTIQYVNPAFEKISGYTRAEALGQNPRILQSGKQDAEFYRRMWDVLTRGEVWHGHFSNKRKDGALYEEDTTISPVRDATGKVINYVAVKRDVTHEVQLEAQFRQSQKMEAIGTLAGGVAHDFNNLLAVIMLQAKLASAAGNLPKETLEGLVGINAAAERAAKLTRQLLLFGRKQLMQPCHLDVNEVVTSLAKILQRVIREDVNLQLHLHSKPLMTYADAGMLDQVLMNLAVNARDAMPNGGSLTIETAEKFMDAEQAAKNPEASPGQFVWFSVSDTGCGIPPEILPRIFEPFFTTKEVSKGTGLGLATVFGIVKQHHGWLKVDSEVGKGTTFQIFLPASDASTAEALAEAAAQPKPRGGSETILVVEDDDSLRMLIRNVLEQNGYQVLDAPDGIKAQQVWAEHPSRIALLLTDLIMPGGMDGRKLAATLRTQNPKLKVTFTSGYSAEIAGRELKLEAGQNFIQKPYGPNQILEVVRACLDN